MSSSTGFPFEPFLLDGAQAEQAASLYRRRGAVVLGPPAIEPEIFDALVLEARVQRRLAHWDLVGSGEPGSLDQDTVRAHLGPLARSFMAAGATRALLRQLTGEDLVPGWSATCLTFYDQPGQHLGRHRDKADACRHALLLYLDSSWPVGDPPGPGVQLHVLEEDESALRLLVTALPNRLVLLHGSRLTHFRPPLAQGESVALLAGCYALAQ